MDAQVLPAVVIGVEVEISRSRELRTVCDNTSGDRQQQRARRHRTLKRCVARGPVNIEFYVQLSSDPECYLIMGKPLILFNSTKFWFAVERHMPQYGRSVGETFIQHGKHGSCRFDISICYY